MLTLVSQSAFEVNKDLLKEMFDMRRRIFCDRLGWDLTSINGLEKDQFDHNEAHYIIYQNPDTLQVIGCVRMMPTSAPHIVRDIFSNTIAPENRQKVDKIKWEVSRLGLLPVAKDSSEVGLIRKDTFRLLLAMFEFSQHLGLTEILAVVDFRMEKIFKICGWPPKRLGQPEIRPDSSAVVVSLEINKATWQRLKEKSGLLEPVIPNSELSKIDDVYFR